MTECLVVLGGGPAEGDLLPPEWTRRRCEAARDLYHQKTAAGQDVSPSPRSSVYVVILTLSGGTAHTGDTIDAQGRAVHESTVSALYLIRLGVPGERIFREWCSYDTIGNALFTRLTLTDPRLWRRLTIITSLFHMPRTRAIFDAVFALDSPTPPYELHYVSVPDEGLPAAALADRVAREARSLTSWQQHRFSSLAELHTWLFRSHACYATALHGSAADAQAASQLYGGTHGRDAALGHSVGATPTHTQSS
eukprot:m.55320 g.55320  ORF g.55320 m.55320 type:complete len:251 (-) comp11962_c0_seq1:1925-2677(-)